MIIRLTKILQSSSLSPSLCPIHFDSWSHKPSLFLFLYSSTSRSPFLSSDLTSTAVFTFIYLCFFITWLDVSSAFLYNSSLSLSVFVHHQLSFQLRLSLCISSICLYISSLSFFMFLLYLSLCISSICLYISYLSLFVYFLSICLSVCALVAQVKTKIVIVVVVVVVWHDEPLFREAKFFVFCQKIKLTSGSPVTEHYSYHYCYCCCSSFSCFCTPKANAVKQLELL